jgi:uncharacterized protein (DUF58 family)
VTVTTFAPVLEAVRGLTWPARARVHQAVSGPHLSRIRGTTVEFIEHRPYRQGDETKRIDWRLVARNDRVFVRVSRELATLPTMFLVDASASMAFPVHTHAKWRLAGELAIGLASVAQHGGDPVGLVVAHHDGMRIIPARNRRTVLHQMMTSVEIPPRGDVSLAPALRQMLGMGERLVIATDFLGDADDLLALARTAVARGIEVYALHLVADGELNPDPRRVLFEDPEQPGMRRPMSPAMRAAYLERFGEWRQRLARDWRHAGAVYCMCVPGSESLRQVVRRITTPGGGTGLGS